MKIVITEKQYRTILKEDVTPKVLVTLNNPLKNGYDYHLQLFGDGTKGWQMRKVGSKSLLWFGDTKGWDIIKDQTKVAKLDKIYNDQLAKEKTKAQTEYDKKVATWKKAGTYKDYLKGSYYSDKYGMPIAYIKSEDFKRNANMLKKQGMVGYDIYAQSPVQHFNIAALESIRIINNALAERFRSNECFRVGLRSFKSINGVSRNTNLFTSYDVDSMEQMFKAGGYGANLVDAKEKGSENLWKNLSFGDFQFGYGQLMQYVKNAPNSNPTQISKMGFYNFYSLFFAEKAGTYNPYTIADKIRALGQHLTCGPAPEKNQFFDFSNITIHDVLSVVQVFSYLIPVAGPIIAAGIGTIDAGIYYLEGKETEAAVTLGLTLLPLVSRIPGIKQVGTETMKKVAKKVVSGTKLSKAEQGVMNLVNKYKDSVNNDLKAFATKAKNFADGQGMSEFKKEALQSKVKSKVKEAVAGDYGMFLSRWKGGPLQKTIKAAENTLKYYRKQLKNTNIAGVAENLQKGDLRKGANFYFAKIGNEYYASRIGDGKKWNSLAAQKKTRQDVERNWDKYIVLA